MVTTALATALVILGALTIFQALLVFDHPLGEYVWGGKHKVLPEDLEFWSVVSIAAYVLFAILLWRRAHVLDNSYHPFIVISVWVFFALVVISIMLTAFSPSRKERVVMTPVCAVLAVATFIVATS
jgi:hypothetical protein